MTHALPPSSEEKCFVIATILCMILFLIGIGMLVLTSCNATPEALKTADDIFDDAIKITVDKSAIQQNTDLNINVEVKNKD